MSRLRLFTAVVSLVGLACSSGKGKAKVEQDAEVCTGGGCTADARLNVSPDSLVKSDRTNPSDSYVCSGSRLGPGQTGPNGLIQLYGEPFGGPRLTVAFNGIGLNGGYVYFRDEKLLRRVSINGGTPETAMTWPAQPTTFIIRDSKVIWGESVADGKARLRQTNLGEDASASTVLADNIAPPQNIIADDQTLYWDVTNLGKGIFKLTLANKNVENLVPDALPNGMVLQGTHLYWNGSPDDFLKRVPLAGGASESVAQIFWGGSLAADDQNIYWADGSYGAVLRWAIAGGTQVPTTLWSRSNHEWPDFIAVTGGRLYFYSNDLCDTIIRMNPDGTGRTAWAELSAKPSAMAYDDKFGYAVTEMAVFRFDR